MSLSLSLSLSICFGHVMSSHHSEQMSQVGGKMSKFQGEFDIVSTDLRIILSNFVATDVYALFKKSIKKICNMMFETKRGGVKAFLNNVQKNCRSGEGGHPLLADNIFPHRNFCESVSESLPAEGAGDATASKKKTTTLL